MGQLRNKCVLEMGPGESETGNWTEWILDEDHWFFNSRGPELCGNASGARCVLTIFLTHMRAQVIQVQMLRNV